MAAIERHATELTPEERAEFNRNNPYRYHVAYSHAAGFGRTEIGLAEPISDGAHVTSIGRFIEARGLVRDVVVLSWQRFEDPTS